MPAKQSEARRRMMALVNGGPVRGPGSGTSDSIPARLSDGEFVLPADTVRKVGIKSLRDLVDMTHRPSGKPAHPARFADGGLVDEQQRRQNSFGDSAAVNADPTVTKVDTGTAPSQFVADQNAKLAQENARLQAQTAQVNATYQPAQNSPNNTFPGNRMPGGNGSSSAPTANPTPSPSAPDRVSPSGLYIQDRAKEISGQLDKGNYAQAAGTAARTAVQGLGMYGIEAADKVVSPWVDATKSFGRGLIGADSSASTASGVPSAAASTFDASTAKDKTYGMPSLNELPKPTDSVAAAPSSGESDSGNQPYAPGQPRPDLGYGPIGDRTKLTNQQAAIMNPAGRITVTRNANGTTEFSGNDVRGQVSYNDASGKTLPGGGLNGKGFSSFEVAPAGSSVATGPNGSYAFSSGSNQQAGSVRERMLAAVGFTPDQQADTTPSQPAAAPVGNARERLLAIGERSPVGMTVEAAQKAGLVGERVGYNPAYDQRINGVRVRPGFSQSGDFGDAQIPAGMSGAQAAQYASEVQAARDNANSAAAMANADNPYAWMKDLRDPRNLALRNASVGSKIFHNKREEMTANKARQARIAGAQAAIGNQMKGEQDANIEREKSDTQLKRESLSQTGANIRAMFTQAIEARRNQIASDRLAIEQNEAGFKSRASQRMEDAQVSLVNAKTPQEQRSARERLLALYGKSDEALWAHSPGGQVVDPKTQQLITQPGVIYNRRTGEKREDGGQVPAVAAMPASRELLVSGRVYQTARGPARWDGGQFQPTQ